MSVDGRETSDGDLCGPEIGRLVRFVHTTSLAGSRPAVCANGALPKGMATGVEIAQRAENITGTPTMFAANVTGVYGGVGSMTGFANIESLEAAQQAMAADAEWAKQVEKAGSAYAAERGVTTQLIHRRFA